MVYIDTENDEFQIIQSLKLNRAKRAKNHEVFIEGIDSIKQAFKAGLDITRIITTYKKSSWALEITGQYEKAGTRVIEMAEDLYCKLCDRSEPSEMLVTAKVSQKSLSGLKLPQKPFVLVLDRTSDTGNLGSIIRSADSFGADAVVLIGHGADIWDPKTIRASMGSVFFNPPVQADSLDELKEFINSVKAVSGMEVWGTDTTGAVSLADSAIKRPLMLILGNEAKGISLGLKEICDGIISIPIFGNVNSLNLASAASIFMWELYRNSDGKS